MTYKDVLAGNLGDGEMTTLPLTRISIALCADAATILAELAASSGKTKATVMRDALFLEKYAQEAWARGGRVLVERGRGREKREVLPH